MLVASVRIASVRVASVRVEAVATDIVVPVSSVVGVALWSASTNNTILVTKALHFKY